MEHRFGQSHPLSLGVEEEIMILDGETLMPAPQVATCGKKNEPTFCMRSQPALSPWDSGGQTMPRGDVSSSFAGPVMVVANAASTSLLTMPFHIAP